MKNEALFRTGSVWKSIFSMAVPSIIIILVMVLYNMADMFFVGCLGDTAQVAAVSVVGTGVLDSCGGGHDAWRRQQCCHCTLLWRG